MAIGPQHRRADCHGAEQEILKARVAEIVEAVNVAWFGGADFPDAS
jgi:hypothetical protein